MMNFEKMTSLPRFGKIRPTSKKTFFDSDHKFSEMMVWDITMTYQS